MDAFVFLRVRPGRVEEVVVDLLASSRVRHAVAVVGDWDVLVATSGADLQALATDVLRTIHRIEGVERTLTAPVIPADVLGLPAGGIGLGLGATLPMQRTGDACFVRIRTATGATTKVFEALAAMEEIAGVAAVAGDDDLLAEVPYGWEEGARVILEQIRAVEGIRSTSTLIAIPSVEPEEEDRDQFSAWS